MQDNYLNINFIPYAKKEDVPNGADNILLIVTKEQADRFEFQKSLAQRIDKTFSENKTAVITTLGERQNFIAVAPDREKEALRLAGASVYASLHKQQIQTVRLRGLDELIEDERYAFLEGMLLSSYDFDKYKAKKKAQPIAVYIRRRSFPEDKIAELKMLAEAVSLTKTLVNEPVNYMDALRFSEVATETGKQFGFETEILHKAQIEELKMGGLLAVNKGSETPPTFNIFHYKPENAVNEKPLVLVGKGVMFDTGGYSLKISGNMLTMKCDMAGGAAVLGTVAAIAGNKLPYHVIGLVPATDNKISANALVVDDVITMMDGTTVEVQNTDAEGRLVLADALTYAKRFEPELVIDMATLTGASAAITGSFGIAVLGNNQEKIEELKEIGEQVYERLLQLPLWNEYRDLLKSSIADMSNLGGPVGGVSTSSIFLEHFTDYPWVHLDIAGAAFVKEAKGYRQNGATAVPVRLLYEFVRRMSRND
ncbi:M17 family metallopeptidase [Elizabethkingia anophelis]|uniref:leucyl aminopeptidase family protein n=1 Tax=Elizabethkingia anophelis TaxID=1117645 RepID=UPI0012B3D838|nr:leucyl aminopeptidase [Elizabethkingia anophelis]QGN24266.1 peptidase M17 [Elizabethkingia anophelis]QNV10907.1 leucyl aminopeptidase [Elizabethkingia anophelis]UTF89061.1 leucyl aminopeptidase [Elizabethkingia anophelis]UTF99983.1 leucyl aminopeptidase [Elizabethkingia anophelis]UTG03698.1 leucyl aminopeptidase [Elizabethkingia anophelis]